MISAKKLICLAVAVGALDGPMRRVQAAKRLRGRKSFNGKASSPVHYDGSPVSFMETTVTDPSRL